MGGTVGGFTYFFFSGVGKKIHYLRIWSREPACGGLEKISNKTLIFTFKLIE